MRREILERSFRFAIVGRDLEDLAVEPACELGIAEPALRDARELAIELEPRRVGQPAGRERALERRDDIAPLLGLAGEPDHVVVERRALRIEIERLERPRERQRLGCELLLAELADLR